MLRALSRLALVPAYSGWGGCAEATRVGGTHGIHESMAARTSQLKHTRTREIDTHRLRKIVAETGHHISCDGLLDPFTGIPVCRGDAVGGRRDSARSDVLLH